MHLVLGFDAPRPAGDALDRNGRVAERRGPFAKQSQADTCRAGVRLCEYPLGAGAAGAAVGDPLLEAGCGGGEEERDEARIRRKVRRGSRAPAAGADELDALFVLGLAIAKAERGVGGKAFADVRERARCSRE